MTHTAVSMIVAVGEVIQMRAGEVWVDVIVRDVKSAWGKHRLLVGPVAGDGQQWVEMSSVRRGPVARAMAAAAFECPVCRGQMEVDGVAGACWQCGDNR